MSGSLDGFVLWLAQAGLNKWLVILYIPCIAITMIGFSYYWYKALRAWFAGAKATGGWKNWRAYLGYSLGFDLRNADLRKYYSYWIKGVAIWFVAGWPLMLIAMGLVSEEAVDVFLGQSTEILD